MVREPFPFKRFTFLYIQIWVWEGRPGRSRVLYLSASTTKRDTDCRLADDASFRKQRLPENNAPRFMGSFLNCGTAMKTGRSRQASKLLKACSAITGLGPNWHFDFWLCGLIIFCHMKTDCVINAKSKFQWKNIYTCRWLRLDEPLWTNWLHIPYNVNWSCDVALNAKQCRRQINNLIRIFFCKSATACAL